MIEHSPSTWISSRIPGSRRTYLYGGIRSTRTPLLKLLELEIMCENLLVKLSIEKTKLWVKINDTLSKASAETYSDKLFITNLPGDRVENIKERGNRNYPNVGREWRKKECFETRVSLTNSGSSSYETIANYCQNHDLH